MTATAGTVTAILAYDPLSRLLKVVKKTGTTTNSDTRFFYDGDAMVAEYNASGAVAERYVHGSNAAADGPLVWYAGANLTAARFLHADQLGSIVAIAGSTGAIITNGTNAYDEYGINDPGNNTAERSATPARRTSPSSACITTRRGYIRRRAATWTLADSYKSSLQSPRVGALWYCRIDWSGGIMHPVSIRARSAIAAVSTFLPSAAFAQDSYSDPAGSGVLVSAVGWLQGTLLGTVATVVAVIAVAAVGFMMLTGRINWRYGVTVVLGCFILFGATSIVAGIHSTATLGQ